MNVKTEVFWDVMQYRLVDIDGRTVFTFRVMHKKHSERLWDLQEEAGCGTSLLCLIHRLADGESTLLSNVSQYETTPCYSSEDCLVLTPADSLRGTQHLGLHFLS